MSDEGAARPADGPWTVAAAQETLAALELRGRLLCHVALELASNAPLIVGQTPWRWVRVSNIAGGTFAGERLSGKILQSGADWAQQGTDADQTPVSHLDVRSLWQTGDGAMIHVTYHGRVAIPNEHWETYRDLAQVERLSPSSYYFRINPLFETADPRYAWLNRCLAIGMGKRVRSGVLYKIFEIL
jgi:hypothetical protein